MTAYTAIGYYLGMEDVMSISTGKLINKLENALALAIMRGDKKAEQKFTQAKVSA